MPRYIDADIFEVVTLENKSEEFIDGVQYILEKIDEQPDADVVPRSEVELLKANHKKQVDRLIDECGNQSTLWRLHFEKIYQNGKETLKQEVAREIFEEIDRITLDGTMGGVYPAKIIHPKTYANLKKKYIGEEE